uniref:Uncharacterized protein n=1 Tax=Podoviridae sp. ct7K12 TaxID=2826540 RepID=A0A8S5N6U0_9CAUD|nr:MAG TPA: hypothetical protein [Podoviridae sp. ct7K12]
MNSCKITFFCYYCFTHFYLLYIWRACLNSLFINSISEDYPEL